MNKIVTSILLSFVLTATVFAQDINKVLKDMPRDIIYGLNPELNEMLLDNPKDTTKFAATVIYENIKRKAINPEFISLQTSKVGTTEIRLLPLINDSKIICVVQTVRGVITDSRISFYTDKWESVDGSDLFPARDINWFIKADADKDSEKYGHAVASLIMDPMQYTLSADSTTISIEFDAKSFLSQEDFKNIEPFLTQKPKVLKWDKGRFK